MTENELKNQIEELQMVTISLQREVQEQAKLLYKRDQRIDQLKKQLAIAVESLRSITADTKESDSEWIDHVFDHVSIVLKQIEELNQTKEKTNE